MSCRAIRARPAPSAARTAISCSRSVARASSRFATLAHAISSTNPTAPKITSSACRTPPTTCSCSGTMFTPQSACRSGCSSRSRAASASILACAASSVTPGASRATTWRNRPGDCRACPPNCGGRHTSRVPMLLTEASGAKSKSGGSTPITSCATPSSAIVVPITAGSPPNRRWKKPWERTTTRGPPSTSSPSSYSRPRCGDAPRSRKNAPVAYTLPTRSGSPPPVTDVLHSTTAAMSWNTPSCSRHTKKFAGETSLVAAPRGMLCSHTVTSRPGSA